MKKEKTVKAWAVICKGKPTHWSAQYEPDQFDIFTKKDGADIAAQEWKASGEPAIVVPCTITY